MSETVHFSNDGILTLCGQSASSYINLVSDYNSNDFCHDCINNTAISEALQLWKRVFEFTSNPFVKGFSGYYCFICDGSPDHEPDCPWLKAKELVKVDEKE